MNFKRTLGALSLAAWSGRHLGRRAQAQSVQVAPANLRPWLQRFLPKVGESPLLRFMEALEERGAAWNLSKIF